MTESNGLREYRKQLQNAKSESIYAAAIEFFRANGFHSSRMVDIARAADVSTATLYKHFKSKEHLFAACIERVQSDGRSENAENDFLDTVARKDLAAIKLPKGSSVAKEAISKYVEA